MLLTPLSPAVHSDKSGIHLFNLGCAQRVEPRATRGGACVGVAKLQVPEIMEKWCSHLWHCRILIICFLEDVRVRGWLAFCCLPKTQQPGLIGLSQHLVSAFRSEGVCVKTANMCITF